VGLNSVLKKRMGEQPDKGTEWLVQWSNHWVIARTAWQNHIKMIVGSYKKPLCIFFVSSDWMSL